MSTYITPEGEVRLKGDLARLWNVERPKVTKAVAIAAAEGDRSENAEYIYGKKKLRQIDSRIHFIMGRLDVLSVVFPDSTRDESRIYFGAWVVLENEDGTERRVRIVGPDEADMCPENISMDSPVGRALLGKRLDDEVTIRRPKGPVVLCVLEIFYEPPGWAQ